VDPRRSVRIVEVGPRDGLQNQPETVPTGVKVRFVEALAGTGLKEVEAGAFVSPEAVPQLADSEEVFRKVRRVPEVVLSALVPNERGLDRALAAGVQKVAVFTAASADPIHASNPANTIAQRFIEPPEESFSLNGGILPMSETRRKRRGDQVIAVLSRHPLQR